jgi:hypothetical protein
MLVHGGVFGEENQILDDFCTYDIGIRTWIQCKQPKDNRDVKIGPRAYHSMVCYVNTSQYPTSHYPNSDQILSSRLVWLPPVAHESQPFVDTGYNKHQGFYLFGGVDSNDKKPSKDLFFI